MRVFWGLMRSYRVSWDGGLVVMSSEDSQTLQDDGCKGKPNCTRIVYSRVQKRRIQGVSHEAEVVLDILDTIEFAMMRRRLSPAACRWGYLHNRE